MRLFPVAYEAWALILLGILLGCTPDSKPPAPAATPSSAPAEEPGAAPVDLGERAELGEYMFGLDNDRLDVARPEGWILGSRTKGYLVRFLRSDLQQYPMILLTAKDYPGLREVSTDNVDEFAQRIKEEELVSGPVDPIVVGQFVGVTYRKRGKAPRSANRILERLLVVTVVAGRKYSVELRTREDRLNESKGNLFAVVEGIRFSEISAPSSGSPDDSVDKVQKKSTKESK